MSSTESSSSESHEYQPDGNPASDHEDDSDQSNAEHTIYESSGSSLSGDDSEITFSDLSIFNNIKRPHRFCQVFTKCVAIRRLLTSIMSYFKIHIP